MLAIPEKIRADQHDVHRLARANPEERVRVKARFWKFSEIEERAPTKQRARGTEVEQALGKLSVEHDPVPDPRWEALNKLKNKRP